jgi:hypothetical protein
MALCISAHWWCTGQELSALGGPQARPPEPMSPGAAGASWVEPGRCGLGQQERASRVGADGYRAGLEGSRSARSPQRHREEKGGVTPESFRTMPGHKSDKVIVRPACPEPAVVEGLRGRDINQAGTRRCHQGSKAMQAFMQK